MYEGPEFSHLKTFVAIAEECNFGKAAKRFHTTQPTLSTQMKKLENGLGQVLFKRVPSGAELTEAGRKFLPYARRILHLRRDAVRAASRGHTSDHEPLRLGYSPFTNHALIEEALTGYRELVPEGRINSSSDCTGQLIEMLEDGSLDAAIVTLPVPPARFLEHRICEDRLLVCLRRDDPLASEHEIPKDVISERLRIMFKRGDHPLFYDKLLRKFKKAGMELQPTETFSAPADMQFLVKNHDFFGLVREHLPLDQALTALPIAGFNMKIATALISHKRQQKPVLAMLAYRMATRWGEQTGMEGLKRPSTGVKVDDIRNDQKTG